MLGTKSWNPKTAWGTQPGSLRSPRFRRFVSASACSTHLRFMNPAHQGLTLVFPQGGMRDCWHEALKLEPGRGCPGWLKKADRGPTLTRRGTPKGRMTRAFGCGQLCLPRASGCRPLDQGWAPRIRQRLGTKLLLRMYPRRASGRSRPVSSVTKNLCSHDIPPKHSVVLLRTS
jgi:hypothetical protein